MFIPVAPSPEPAPDVRPLRSARFLLFGPRARSAGRSPPPHRASCLCSPLKLLASPVRAVEAMTTFLRRPSCGSGGARACTGDSEDVNVATTAQRLLARRVLAGRRQRRAAQFCREQLLSASALALCARCASDSVNCWRYNSKGTFGGPAPDYFFWTKIDALTRRRPQASAEVRALSVRGHAPHSFHPRAQSLWPKRRQSIMRPARRARSRGGWMPPRCAARPPPHNDARLREQPVASRHLRRQGHPVRQQHQF